MRIFIARRPADSRADNYFNAGRREKILMRKSLFTPFSRVELHSLFSLSTLLAGVEWVDEEQGILRVYATVLLCCSRCLSQPGSRLHYKFLNVSAYYPYYDSAQECYSLQAIFTLIFHIRMKIPCSEFSIPTL